MGILSEIHVTSITLLLGMSGCLVGGFFVGYLLRKKFSEYQIKESETLGQKIIEEAEKEAENRKKTVEVEMKEHRMAMISELEKEKEAHNRELHKQEMTLAEKEAELKLSIEKSRAAEREFEEKKKETESKGQALEQKQNEFNNLIQQEIQKLETIANYTAEEAKEAIRNEVLDEARLEVGKEIKRIEENAHRTAENEARRIISYAIQRSRPDHVAESIDALSNCPTMISWPTTTRRRNIRALDQATGIDPIIDDTPGAVVLSGFDPIRREIARRVPWKN